MAHLVVAFTEARADAVMEGLDPDIEPCTYCALPMLKAVKQACESTKGKLAYEEYKKVTARRMHAFVHKAKELGYTWPQE
jgi:hypothetical protein